MSEGFDPVVAPADAFDYALSQRPSDGTSPVVLPPAAAPPAAAPVAPAAIPAAPAAAPAAAAPAPAGQPAQPVVPTFPPPSPEGGFEVVEPTPQPTALDAIRQATREAVREVVPPAAAPTPAAPVESKIVTAARALLVDPEAGASEKLLAEAVISQHEDKLALRSELDGLKQRVDARETAERTAKAAEAEQQLDVEAQALMSKYFITPQEIEQFETAWDTACQKDSRFGILSYPEAAARYFGPASLQARVRPTTGPGAPPAPLAPPAAPGVHPNGHLASDAATGAPPAGNRPYTPVQRERGPQLEDARRAAHAALDSR